MISGTAPAGRRLAGDHGFLARSAVKLLIAFSLLAVAANEVGQMIMTKVRVENAAGAAAQAGADTSLSSSSLLDVRSSAEQALAASDPSATLTSVEVVSPGAVRVQAKDTANTIVLQRVSFLRSFGVETGDEEETHGS